MRGELFTAERGGGAFLNGRRLSRVRAPTRSLDSLLVHGVPLRRPHSASTSSSGCSRAFVGQARAVRRLGSAALDLCYVAAGRIDGFWEQRLKPWDVAAAALIVEEAGGRTSDLDGQPFNARTGRLVATNGRIHLPMLDTIAAFQGERARNRTR